MSTVLVFLLLLLLNLHALLEAKPSFVFVLTDDQDLVLDGLVKPMKRTLKLLADEGITFTNAFVNSPICCPSRSTILTGKHAHNTFVFNNSLSGNCSSRSWQTDFEPYSVSGLLKSKGYSTFYAGKYLNQYGKAGGLKVPKGYDWWLGLEGNSKYYNYTLSVNGSRRFFKDDYLTDVIKDYALQYLNSRRKDEPFFLTVAPPASHAPFTPARRHEMAFAEVKAVRNPAFNFSTSDKHWLVQMPPKTLPSNVTILDQIQRGRLQTLLAVDEMVSELISKLDEIGVLNNTFIVFTSDNGFHIGQFTQPWDKRQPYQSDVRVPFLMRGPGIPKKILSKMPISSVDIAPTILDLAGFGEITADFDGTSFKGALFPKNATPTIDRRQTNDKLVLIEYWGEGDANSVAAECPQEYRNGDFAECTSDNWCKCQDAKNNTYACILHFSEMPLTELKYCQFPNGFAEVYDLLNDPYELVNVHKYMDEASKSLYAETLEILKNCRGSNCSILENVQ